MYYVTDIEYIAHCSNSWSTPTNGQGWRWYRRKHQKWWNRTNRFWHTNHLPCDDALIVEEIVTVADEINHSTVIHKANLDKAGDSEKNFVSTVLSNMSYEEREEKKTSLPKMCSSLSKPPHHRIKNYERIDHLDFALPKLYSSADYTYYRTNKVLQSMIRDMTSIEDITSSLSSNDTCKTDSTIYCELSYHFKKFSDHIFR